MSRLKTLLMISSMNGGGSERQTLLLLRHLDRDQFEPHLYLTQRTGSLLNDIPNDVTIHTFENAPPNQGAYFPGKELKRQSDYVQSVLTDNDFNVIYDRTFHMSLIAASPAFRLAVPRVSTIVSPPDFALPHVEKRFVTMKRRRISRALRRSAAVVSVSHQAAESASKYYRLPLESIKVIHNPVDVDQVRQTTARKTQASETTIVCIARMTEEKGHADLVEALALLQNRTPDIASNLRVELIGDGPIRANLERQINTLGLSATVTLLGQQDDPMPYLTSADAMVLPSHFEGMPNVVLEAMAAGIPVIATRVGGTIELQRDAETIFWADSEDPESLADAINTFLNQPETAQQHVAASTQLIENHHTVNKTVRRIESVLVDASRHKGDRIYDR